MKKRLTGIMVMGVALHTFPINANPMVIETFLVRQTPGHHVQLTYVNAMREPPVPSLKSRFGRTSTPWMRMKQPYRTNLGSGVSRTHAIQMCDCDVPGDAPLTYAVTVTAASGEKAFTMQGTTTVSPAGKGSEAPKSAHPRKRDSLRPWEIPDPPGLQGLDCVQACRSAAAK
jgi:hypothetical protein